MATQDYIAVSSLRLDLNNYRTTKQMDEESAISTLIAINPEWFWALMESIVDDGYEPTENIIVMKIKGGYIVKEGNRRIACMKLISENLEGIDLPSNIGEKIAALTGEWKKENAKVPCTIYDESEKDKVQKLVARIHGKGQKSGRDNWNALAKARWSRDEGGNDEPGLDLLEEFLAKGKTHSPLQRERWSGEYPITVLDETLQKLYPILKMENARQIVISYPKKNKSIIDKVMFDIGEKTLGFQQIRDPNTFWGNQYGLTKPKDNKVVKKVRKKKIALASTDPKSINNALKKFIIYGAGREKVKTLCDEIKTINIENYPHAFCFVLRSMFEISARVYCDEHGPSCGLTFTNNQGKEKSLAAVLDDITKHLTQNGSDKNKIKELHGANARINKPDSLLSVTSMNQLIHNPNFSISPSEISTLFNNIFPLLREMNQ
jgi:hypothetical protein